MTGQAGSPFARNVLTLMGGTAVAQAIPLLASPLLARLYAPEQFGALAILLAVANPMSLLVCGRYEQTVVLPREEGTAAALARLGLVLAVLVSLVLGTVIWAFRSVWGAWLGGEAARVPLLLSPLLFLLMGFFQPMNNWLIRKQAFRAMGLNKLVQTSTITAASLLLGLLAARHGLLLGYIAGWAAYVAIGAWLGHYAGLRYGPLHLPELRRVARAYAHFPLYNAVPAVLNTATLSVPVFLLAKAFDGEVTGQFNLCRQTILVPVTFLASSYMQVYMQRASGTVNEAGPVLPGLLGGLKLLGLAAAGLVAVLVAAGPWLFGLVFGEAWSTAGAYARILAVPIALQLLVVPFTPLLPALGRIRAQSLWQVAYFAGVALIGLYPFAHATDYLTALAVVESACFIALGLLVLRSAKRHDAHLAAPTDGTAHA